MSEVEGTAATDVSIRSPNSPASQLLQFSLRPEEISPSIADESVPSSSPCHEVFFFLKIIVKNVFLADNIFRIAPSLYIKVLYYKTRSQKELRTHLKQDCRFRHVADDRPEEPKYLRQLIVNIYLYLEILLKFFIKVKTKQKKNLQKYLPMCQQSCLEYFVGKSMTSRENVLISCARVRKKLYFF